VLENPGVLAHRLRHARIMPLVVRFNSRGSELTGGLNANFDLRATFQFEVFVDISV
jgi:hypothetical protein